MNILKAPDPSCELFVARCLQFLDKRYREAREGKKYYLLETSKPKKFSERELGDATGINWPALKDGRRRSLPSREVVMLLADYLECSLNERNELLASAAYSPVQALLEGEALEEVLKPYRVTLFKYIHYPAYIINRNWNILEVNPAGLVFFGIDPAVLLQLPKHILNILWLNFDPNLPIRPMTEALGHSYWQQVARRFVLGFRWENRLSTQEQWYKEMVERLKQLPDFEQIYSSADPADFEQQAGLEFLFKSKRPDGTVVSTRSLLAKTGNLDYPKIEIYLPGDKSTEELFKLLGFLLPPWCDNYIIT